MELQKLIDGLKAHKSGAASYESVDEAIRVFEAMRDVDWENAVNGLELCTESIGYEGCITCPYHEDYYPYRCRYANAKDALCLIRQQQERIAELEAEISRLKHHVDCDAAEKIPSGCVGYGRGFNDDEPCETCKACEKYNLYGEENGMDWCRRREGGRQGGRRKGGCREGAQGV